VRSDSTGRIYPDEIIAHHFKEKETPFSSIHYFHSWSSSSTRRATMALGILMKRRILYSCLLSPARRLLGALVVTTSLLE
jgi:hypothetical protein